MILLLLLLFPLASATFTEQSTGAKGYVSCRGVRQPGAFVQLFDEDTISFLDSDDLMGSATANGVGAFCVKGTTSELTQIDPYILIEHNCGYEGTGKKTIFFYYLDRDFIVEGNVSQVIQSLGEIELMTGDAPVQVYSRPSHHRHRQHIHRTQQARINECIPLYVTYKDYFEKEVFGDRMTVVHKELEKDGSEEVVLAETIVTEKKESEDIHELETVEEERLKIEKDIKRVEEERLLVEQRLLEEERLREEELRKEEQRRIDEERLEEQRRLEEERQLVEERRREEENKREEERKAREEERKKEEERARLEYEKRMEEYRKREEERQAEIRRREEERSKSVVTTHEETSHSGYGAKHVENMQTHVENVNTHVENVATHDGNVKSTEEQVDYDPCAYRAKRKIEIGDPCYRRLRG